MAGNNTYNIIMALASNLEAFEAYKKYAKDGNRELWERLSKNVEEAVRLLQEKLPEAMQQGGKAGGSRQAYPDLQAGVSPKRQPQRGYTS